MGPLLVELVTEAIELQLLGPHRVRRWARGFCFEGAMHALMTPVLLGLARFDELRQDTESHPPGRMPRQSGQRVGGERHAIVGADELRQAVLLEDPGKHGLGVDDRGR